MDSIDIENLAARVAARLRQGPLPEYLSTEDAAAVIGCDPQTLDRWRNKGTGPRFVRVSHRLVRYRLDDLREFMDGFAVEPRAAR